MIGSGIAGTTAALVLAEAGLCVTLFERNATLFSGASAVCEGKIHLGYTYVLDPTDKTAQFMLAGAGSFVQILTRWVPKDSLGLSERPFQYATPRDSMVPPEEVGAHFTRIRTLVEAHGTDLLRYPDIPVRRLTQTEADDAFDPHHISAVWETDELACDPVSLRPHFVAALQSGERLTLRTNAEVTHLAKDDAGFKITVGPDGQTEHFDAVVNASWEQRLRLDAMLGLKAPQPVMHRFKCGLYSDLSELAARPANVTFVLGEYGDTVTYRNRLYLSWYPACLLRQEVSVAPDPQPVTISSDEAARIARDSLAALSRLMPGYGAALEAPDTEWEVRGGYISAWGKSGIRDCSSQLHSRSNIGVTSVDGYHSVNSGKFSTTPLFGKEAAERVLAELGVPA